MAFGAKCNVWITENEICGRDVYENDLCILHLDSPEKPSKIFNQTMREAFYSGDTNFSKIISYEDISLENFNIENGANIYFKNAIFYAPFRTNNILLNCNLDFTDSIFNSIFDLRLCNVCGDINFRDALFYKGMNLSLANVNNLYADGCKHIGVVNFSNINIKGTYTAIESVYADLVNFNNAKFMGEVTLESANFNDEVNFACADFYQNTSFKNVSFKKTANFLNAVFHAGFTHEGCLLEKNETFKRVFVKLSK